MNATQTTQVGDVESPNDIRTDGFCLVIFTPINIRTPGNTRRHEYMRGFDLFQFGVDIGTIFNTDL
jgi:hypothetical protein